MMVYYVSKIPSSAPLRLRQSLWIDWQDFPIEYIHNSGKKLMNDGEYTIFFEWDYSIVATICPCDMCAIGGVECLRHRAKNRPILLQFRRHNIIPPEDWGGRNNFKNSKIQGADKWITILRWRLGVEDLGMAIGDVIHY